MDKKPIKAEIFTWITEDFSEYWKLIGLSISGTPDDQLVNIANEDETTLYDMFSQCENCERIFSITEFEKHICDYSDRNTFIYDDEIMKILWEESSLRKMYEENNKAIQQILDQNSDVSARSKETKKPMVQTENVCSICHRQYVHASGLARHMETHTNSNEPRYKSLESPSNKDNTAAEVIKCLICGRIFSSSSSCFSHLKTSHADYGFNESDSSLKAGESLLYEKIVVDQVFQCEFCDLLYADTADLYQHKMDHDVTTGYKCSSCDLSSRKLAFILNHRNNECPYEMYEKHPKISCKLRFICSECDTTFDSLVELYEHRNSNKHFQTLFSRTSEQYEFFCEKCGETCGSDANNLMMHIETEHTKKIKAQILPVSATVRPYLCEVCGKGYTQSSHLYQHLRFHKGIKPFECTKDGCNRKFTIRPDLNDHIRKCHTGERPYKCSDCNKTFLTGSVYYQHRLIHRNERRYGCRTCEKRFHRSDALKNHERIHSGEKPYACGVCTKTFRQKGDRDKHFRSRHQHGLLGLNSRRDENPSNFLMELSQMRSMFKQVNGVDVLTISKN